jgi:hypothetical protein
LVGSLRAKAVLILIAKLLWIFGCPKGNTRFMYVLPTSTSEAFTRIYLFSHDLLEKKYEIEIQNYMSNLGITDYEITEKNKEVSL